MNRQVHYRLTKQWAIEVGFSEEDAETIAVANVEVDRVHKIRGLRNTSYHYAWLGARRRARLLFAEAVSLRDLVLLGEALHCLQDAIAHGNFGHIWHWPGIDLWDRRSARFQERLTRRSKSMLNEYFSVTLVKSDGV